MKKSKKNILEHFTNNYTPVYDTWKYRYYIDPDNGDIYRIEKRYISTTGYLDKANHELYATRQEVNALKGGENNEKQPN